MTKEQIIALIDKKIAEHKFEVTGSEDLAGKLKQNNGANPSVEFAQKLMILKDKQVFHRSCILCLEDLKNELS